MTLDEFRSELDDLMERSKGIPAAELIDELESCADALRADMERGHEESRP